MRRMVCWAVVLLAFGAGAGCNDSKPHGGGRPTGTAARLGSDQLKQLPTPPPPPPLPGK